MVRELREKFNADFTDEKYNALINDIENKINRKLDFRICETPLFLDKKNITVLVDAAYEIAGIIEKIDFGNSHRTFVPEKYFVPNEDSHPLFLQIDFAITQDEEGNILPQLIELQGFPSLYNFQAFLDSELRKFYDLPSELTPYFNGLDYDSYIEKLKRAMIGDSNPENVILLEIDPYNQKTWIDFHIAEMQLGIKPVCISDVIQEGKNLYYEIDGRKIKIDKIYNRVIFDELERSEIKPSFNFFEEFNVTWLSHPNWFFKISKNILPLIKSKYAPPSYYLDELSVYPGDLENYVLKPLFSFAGSGVKIEISQNDLDKIKDKENYILQRKVKYEPVIKTPDGYAKAEVRMMFLWEDKPELVNNLLRVSKGKMIGVDYNKNKTWVGANIMYHE